MAVIKSAAKVAAAAGALTLGLGAAVYEGALNTKFSQIMGEKLHFTDDDTMELFEGDYHMNCMRWLTDKCLQDNVITDNGLECHALILKNKKPSDKWVILCHGYTSEPLNMCNFAKEYYSRGFNCVIPSMRGHANDKAKYCSMGYYDKLIVKAWAKYIELEYPNSKTVIHGVSMGAATTLLTVGEKDLPSNVVAAVSDCGYTNLCEQYKEVLKSNSSIPSFPLLQAMNSVSLMHKNFDFRKVSPIDSVTTALAPVLFIHGEEDDFVPYYMLDELYNACSSEKEKLTVPGAKHAVASLVDTELYWKTVDEFLKNRITD